MKINSCNYSNCQNDLRECDEEKTKIPDIPLISDGLFEVFDDGRESPKVPDLSEMFDDEGTASRLDLVLKMNSLRDSTLDLK